MCCKGNDAASSLMLSLLSHRARPNGSTFCYGIVLSAIDEFLLIISRVAVTSVAFFTRSEAPDSNSVPAGHLDLRFHSLPTDPFSQNLHELTSHFPAS